MFSNLSCFNIKTTLQLLKLILNNLTGLEQLSFVKVSIPSNSIAPLTVTKDLIIPSKHVHVLRVAITAPLAAEHSIPTRCNNVKYHVIQSAHACACKCACKRGCRGVGVGVGVGVGMGVGVYILHSQNNMHTN